MSEASGPELRIGDSEREAAVAALGDHYASGRLTKEEYDERAARAWEARTRSALWPLFSDLPRPGSERPDRDMSGSTGPTRHPGAPYGSYPRWRFAGLLPLLVIFALIAVFTHFWLLPVVLVVLLVAKMSHYRGHPAGRRYHSWR
jgi:hypothetical protein